MPVLTNPRWEKFARAVATGVTPTKAYSMAGYSHNPGSAGRLHKTEEVCKRINELGERATEKALDRACISKEWVLGSMQEVAIRCMSAEDFQPAAAIRALELLGREIKLFRDNVDHNFKWNGDLNTLTQSQKDQLWLSLEAIAFKDNPAGLAAFQAETNSMMKTIEASSEEVVGSHEEANIADGTGEDGLLSAAGPASDTADSGRRIIDIPSLREGDG